MSGSETIAVIALAFSAIGIVAAIVYPRRESKRRGEELCLLRQEGERRDEELRRLRDEGKRRDEELTLLRDEGRRRDEEIHRLTTLDVRVRVHRGVLYAPGQPEAWFVNVLNASPIRPAAITHVWLVTEPETPVLTRKPPSELSPGHEWETWILVADVPATTEDVHTLARVRLTTGDVIPSVPREDVPRAGFVPG